MKDTASAPNRSTQKTSSTPTFDSAGLETAAFSLKISVPNENSYAKAWAVYVADQLWSFANQEVRVSRKSNLFTSLQGTGGVDMFVTIDANVRTSEITAPWEYIMNSMPVVQVDLVHSVVRWSERPATSKDCFQRLSRLGTRKIGNATT